MKIKRFEDIKAWEEARGLTKKIYKITDTGFLIMQNLRYLNLKDSFM